VLGKTRAVDIERTIGSSDVLEHNQRNDNDCRENNLFQHDKPLLFVNRFYFALVLNYIMASMTDRNNVLKGIS
jgi:hypothetical protein